MLQQDIMSKEHRLVVYIAKDGTTLPALEMYNDEKMVKALTSHVEEVLPGESGAAVSVERAAALAYIPISKKPEKRFVRVPVSELPSGFPWPEYLRALLGRQDVPEFVIVEAKGVAEAAVSAMKMPGAKAYERWMTEAYLARHASDSTQQKHWRFFGAHLRGQQGMKPREWRLAEEVAASFPLSLIHI